VGDIRRLADDLPTYRVNILAKIADVRGAGKGGSVEKLQETIEGIKTDLGQSRAPTRTASRPVVVTSELVTGFSGFLWLGPILGPVGTAVQAGFGTACLTPQRLQVLHCASVC